MGIPLGRVERGFLSEGVDHAQTSLKDNPELLGRRACPQRESATRPEKHFSIFSYCTLRAKVVKGQNLKPKEILMSAATEIEKQLITLSSQYGAAYLNRDIQSLRAILADDWRLITAGCGDVENKARQLRELEDGTLRVEAIDDSEVNCRVYGDAAVVVGLRKSKVTYNKRDVSDLTRFSQFYVRLQGKWQCVSTQVTSISPKTSRTGH